MKNAMKLFAMVTLSTCVMAGGVVSGFAAAPETIAAAVTAHQTSKCGGSSNAQLAVRFTDAEGNAKLYTICAEGGEVNGVRTLAEVTRVNANFSGVKVFAGALDNGEQVLTVACLGSSGALTGSTASVWLPKDVVGGYDLYQVNADGTETKLEQEEHSQSVVVRVNMEDGAGLLRMAAQNG